MHRHPLADRVLTNDRITLTHDAGADVQGYRVDRRLLALMLHAEDYGWRIYYGPIRSGHSAKTASGAPSLHHVSRAVDIAIVNSSPVSLRNDRAHVFMSWLIERWQAFDICEVGGPFTYKHPRVVTFTAGHGNHIHVGVGPHNGVDAARVE